MANSFIIRKLWRGQIGYIYTLMKLEMLKLHGGYLSFSLHEFL